MFKHHSVKRHLSNATSRPACCCEISFPYFMRCVVDGLQGSQLPLGIHLGRQDSQRPSPAPIGPQGRPAYLLCFSCTIVCTCCTHSPAWGRTGAYSTFMYDVLDGHGSSCSCLDYYCAAFRTQTMSSNVKWAGHGTSGPHVSSPHPPNVGKESPAFRCPALLS